MIPHNAELEQMMIGLALVDRTVPYDAKHLSTVDFYVPTNRVIWAAICEIDEERQPLDIPAVYNRANLSQLTMSDLSKLTLGIPPNVDCGREVKTLKNLTALRTLQKGFSDLSEKAEMMVPLDTLIDQTETLLDAVKESRNEVQGTSTILAEVYERDVFPRIDKFVSGEMVKVPYGWDLLDRSTGGGAGLGELIVLGAKPKSGKSGLMLQIARQQAERNIGCYICSREMLNFENGFRVLAQTSKYTSNHFRSGLYAETAASLKEHGRATGGIPLHLDDKAKNVRDMRKEIDRLEATGHAITSVFVDYVQLIRGLQSGNRADDLEQIIYDLKDLAMERNLCVFANAQFNRDGIDSSRPKMSDFKGSSAIEMAANVVLLWTVDQDVNVTYKARKGQLWIEAGRNVAYDEFDILFYGEKSLFEFL